MFHMTHQATNPQKRSDTLVRRFQQAAERHPFVVAVRNRDAALTYRELSAAAERVAERLDRVAGDRPGPVAVLLEPGPRQVTAALAALLRGTPYLPIDPAYPRDRVERILVDAAPAALVTPGEKPADVTVAPGRWGAATRVTAEDAYVIYTSGSTGTPKGIVIQHRGILNLLDVYAARRPVPPGSRFSTCASPGFDAAVLETWTSLTEGGELVVAPDDRRWHPAGFAAWLAEERVAHAYIPAAFLPAVAQALRDGLDLRSLARAIVAVEPIPRGLLGDIKRALPDLTLINGYGPTEAAVCVTMYEVTPDDDGAERTPIGTAIPGIDLRVEPIEPPEPTGRPAAAQSAADDADAADDAAGGPAHGVTGELHIGGVGVGRAIRPAGDGRSPFYVRAAADGTPVPYYRSGDIVRVDAGGVHTFLGRVDDMVKIRGYRVEPGDVEHALLAHPGIAQAVVLKRTADRDPSGADQLVAHVIPADGAPIDRPALYRLLRDRLPWYAVPHRIVVRDAYPLTGHGKIDRTALAAQAPEPAEAADPSAGGGPEPDTDPGIARLWREALGAGPADPRASFLANGGDSLAAGRLAAALTHRFGRRVRVLDILLAEDLPALAAIVGDAPADEDGDPAPPARAARPGAGVPATYGQRGLWFHDRLHPGSVVYNEPIILRLRGALDAGALARAIGAVIARHEALRTSLVARGGELLQIVRPPTRHDLVVQDLRALPRQERAAAERRAVRDTVRRPFDLAAGPTVRSRLLRVSEREHLLVLAMHHSAFDGGSADVLFEELAALYAQFTTGRDAALQPPPSQYADHALRQHALVDGGHLDDDIAYWRERLSGLPDTMDLPTDFPRPKTASGAGALLPGRLPRDLVERLDALARSAGATRYTALLAALHLLLARYCGTDDVVVGTPFAGRDRPETRRAIGYYLNTLPLRADLSGTPTFRELLARTRRTVTDAHAHHRVPYGLVVDRVRGTTPAESPYLQVCLVPEDIYRHEMTFAGIDSTFEYHDTGIAKFDLTLSLIPDAGGDVRLSAEYRTDLFRASTVERMLRHYRALLDAAVARPDVPVDRLEMLPTAERARVLGEFATGNLGTPPDSDTPVHHLVDRWAARTPDALAAVTDDERLTYRQLIDKAGRLANHLAELGAEPGARIGVRLPRGLDAVTAFLAVLKTGAAYVPLDPAYPEPRLALMTEDADLLLTVTPELLAEDRAAIDAAPPVPPATAVTADDTAYVIYTSGSTGRPKGVEIPHRAVADLASGARRWAGVGPGARLLLVASLSFDMVTFDIWGALANGARLTVAPPGALTAHHIATQIARHGITHGDLPTALFHRQIEESPAAFAGLRTLLVGGEVLNPALAAAALAANPGLRLINGYGPTEATTYSTFHTLTSPDDVPDPIPLGRPTPGTRARILDPHRRPVPIGIVGELHLGGPGLASGYLDRPDLTAERFTDDPYGAPGERLYRTGDLARWRPDGTIEYAGRADGQIKLFGYRVEPGDIEAALRAHPAVIQAVVTRREDRPGRPYLAAYYTTAPGAEVTARDLTDLAAARLPSYMVPRVFTALERIPVTEGGKIDRTALPAPAAARPAPQVPARTTAERAAADDLAAVQERVAAIWRDVITADTLGPDERLFDIGGASLHVALIHQRVADHFGLAGLRMIDLFAHPTIRSYAAHVHRLCVRESRRDGVRSGGGRPGGGEAR
jgi:amino acid adenylation domain-containing protein